MYFLFQHVKTSIESAKNPADLEGDSLTQQDTRAKLRQGCQRPAFSSFSLKIVPHWHALGFEILSFMRVVLPLKKKKQYNGNNNDTE